MSGGGQVLPSRQPPRLAVVLASACARLPGLPMPRHTRTSMHHACMQTGDLLGPLIQERFGAELALGGTGDLVDALASGQRVARERTALCVA